jgi:hypothetical protein
MSTYTITQKNQVTIDPKIIQFMGLKPGNKISYVIEKDGTVKLVNPKQLIKSNRGSVKLPERFKNKDLNQVIEEAKKEYFTHTNSTKSEN